MSSSRLKNWKTRPTCRRRNRAVAEPVDPLAADPDRPGGGPVQPGDEVEQRGLATAGWSHDGDGLAGRDRRGELGDGRCPAAVVSL